MDKGEPKDNDWLKRVNAYIIAVSLDGLGAPAECAPIIELYKEV